MRQDDGDIAEPERQEESNEEPHRKRKAITAAILLALAVGGFIVLTAVREPARKREAPTPGVLVDTITATRERVQRELHAEGTLVPRNVVQVRPQVSGEVAWVNDSFERGSVVEAGAPLIRVEEDDFRLALRQARAEVQKAKAALAKERGRQRVARREYQLFADELDLGDDPEAQRRALRKPELQEVQANLEAAQSGVEQAELNLERTTVTAPFRGFVREESVDTGSLVTAGEPIGTLVGTEVFWVEVTLPQDQLDAIETEQRHGSGTPVRIVHDTGSDQVIRSGRVERILGDLEEQSRLARLLVRVEDPLALAAGDETPPLMLGSFVQVQLQTDQLEPLIQLPREAVREGDRAYVASEGALEVRELGIAWKDEDSVYVSTGVEAGEMVIISPLARAVDGMKLRVRQQPPKTARGDPR